MTCTCTLYLGYSRVFSNICNPSLAAVSTPFQYVTSKNIHPPPLPRRYRLLFYSGILRFIAFEHHETKPIGIRTYFMVYISPHYYRYICSPVHTLQLYDYVVSVPSMTARVNLLYCKLDSLESVATGKWWCSRHGFHFFLNQMSSFCNTLHLLQPRHHSTYPSHTAPFPPPSISA